MQRYVLFDAGCAMCRGVAREVEEIGEGRLTARSLGDPEVQALLERARPRWEWEPALLEVDGAEVRAFTGARMRLRVLSVLGPRRAVRLARLVSGVGRAIARPRPKRGLARIRGAFAPVTASAAYDGDVAPQVDSGDICALLGLGTGAAGVSKTLANAAKGASWVGIGVTIGCWVYDQAKDTTPAQQRAAMQKSYDEYRAMSDSEKLEAFGYSCRRKDSGGGGGTDSVEPKAGWRTITMKGVEYRCSQIRD